MSLKEIFEETGAYYYESKFVKKGRKPKRCSSCGQSINVGEPALVVTAFNGDYFTIDICDNCSKTKTAEIRAMENGDYNNYD